MSIETEVRPSRRVHPAAYVLAGGFVAGLLDLVFAMSYWALESDVPGIRILQSVAAGLLGPASYEGGGATAALGLCLHFSIALTMSIAYFAAVRSRPWLWQRPMAVGALYGLFLYVVMTFLVVPLSAASAGSRAPEWIVASIAAHVFLVGIPIALFARQALLDRDAG